ncbi:MAG TPA: hypothetical protein VGN63_04425 [Flavisolibacter sp.]|jgi:hypothetical protein|nr:hypothetical protein [Flavisolibacter sp.]
MKPASLYLANVKKQKFLLSLFFVLLSSLLFALLWVSFIVAAIKVLK